MLKIKQKDIIMSHKEYVDEHVRLIKAMQSGDEDEIEDECEKQLEELKGRISKKEFESLGLSDEEESDEEEED